VNSKDRSESSEKDYQNWSKAPHPPSKTDLRATFGFLNIEQIDISEIYFYNRIPASPHEPRYPLNLPPKFDWAAIERRYGLRTNKRG
jgi:hypothetical protein